MEWNAQKSANSPSGLKYYLHASPCCVNVCRKRWSNSLRRRSRPHNTTAHLSENPWTRFGPRSPMNFSKALSHFGWANRRRWRGQRARLDVLQLPMGNVSPPHRRGITNSLLSILTSSGGSKLPSPPSTESYVRREKEQAPASWEMYLTAFEDILTRQSYFSISSHRLAHAVINRKALTLFTYSLKDSLLFICMRIIFPPNLAFYILFSNPYL